MKLWSNSFNDGDRIPTQFAMGKYNPESNSEFSDNKNPHLEWSDLPEGTKSLAIICVDKDVPSSPENVNKEGVTVPHDLARVDFYHWVLINLPADINSISEGEFSNGITAKGKEQAAPHNALNGLNNYTQWFEGNPDMGGDYFGYDGPYPPFNDERLHHYYFTLYALDIDKLDIDGKFSGPDAAKAMQGHILGEACIMGTYAIYQEAK